MSYVYIKHPPKSKAKKKYLALVFFIFGLFLVSQATIPILKFQFFDNSFTRFASPVSAPFYNKASQVLGDNTTDYTKLSNWFAATANQGALDGPTTSTYTITVPKLKIQDALVSIGGQDLSHSLIHYQNTASPGQLGGPAIFGHSVLPQFFNPKNYMTIFSTLHKLKLGDEIFINYDQVLYKYKIEDMYETTPEDLSVLEQRFDDKYLTLVTCHPPGTYISRLVVKARLIDY